jgi:hypothetical protein
MVVEAGTFYPSGRRGCQWISLQELGILDVNLFPFKIYIPSIRDDKIRGNIPSSFSSGSFPSLESRRKG